MNGTMQNVQLSFVAVIAGLVALTLAGCGKREAVDQEIGSSPEPTDQWILASSFDDFEQVTTWTASNAQGSDEYTVETEYTCIESSGINVTRRTFLDPAGQELDLASTLGCPSDGIEQPPQISCGSYVPQTRISFRADGGEIQRFWYILEQPNEYSIVGVGERSRYSESMGRAWAVDENPITWTLEESPNLSTFRDHCWGSPVDEVVQDSLVDDHGGRDFADIGREGDIMLGDPDAPVSIVEYASPTCPHCAQFHVQVFPLLKEEYIDTGLVRYTMRAMPTAPQAMSALAFMLGRCVDEGRYYDFMEALFRTQNQWAFNPDPQARIDALASISRQNGMSQEQLEVCRRDEAELQRVQDQAEEAFALGVTSTPSFFINGELQTGALAWEQFEQLLFPHLPEEYRPEGYVVPAPEPEPYVSRYD